MSAIRAGSDALRRRLRWRGRRGLLENDLIVARFLDRHEGDLSDADVGALLELFDLGDIQLMDLLLARCELPRELDRDAVRQVLGRLRAA